MNENVNDIIQNIKFEINSLIGRIFFSKYPLNKNTEKVYLNLGCSTHLMQNWKNADFYPNIFSKSLIKNIKQKNIWFIDLRYNLKSRDNFFNGIYTSHTLEHLSYNENIKLLKELFRILKNKSYIRIVLPDLRKYILYYNNMFDFEVKSFQYKAQSIHHLTQESGHKSVWDMEILKEYLGEAGFKNINEVKYMEGNDNNLLVDLEVRKWESFYCEAQKFDN